MDYFKTLFTQASAQTISVHERRLTIEREQKWDEMSEKIPFIPFPSIWKIKVIPPTMDAVVRFLVMLPSGTIKSIYLDSSCSLGWGGDSSGEPHPYWEVFPVGEDVGRCAINDVVELLRLIEYERKRNDDEKNH